MGQQSITCDLSHVILTFMVDAKDLVWVVDENYPNLCPKLL
jgi:hypothetical protein